MGKIFQVMVFRFLKNALNLRSFTHAQVPHSKLSVEHILKICFLQDGRGGRRYNLLYQNLIRKYEDDLEHWFIYVLYDLQFF